MRAILLLIGLIALCSADVVKIPIQSLDISNTHEVIMGETSATKGRFTSPRGGAGAHVVSLPIKALT